MGRPENCGVTEKTEIDTQYQESKVSPFKLYRSKVNSEHVKRKRLANFGIV